MTDIDPAMLAKLDQSVASIDTSVTRYTTQIDALIDKHGKEAGTAIFHRWLHSQPPDAVAALATGALARLALLAR